MKFISIDIESYSDIDINKAGVYRYVDTEEFKILLFAYSVDGGPVQLIDLTRGDSIPKEIVEALSDKSVTKWAYNANFERVALSRFLGMPTGQYLDPEGWKCSMVWAATLGLPMGLDKVGEVLALDKQKMSEGRGLIYKFCKLDKKTGKRVMPDEFPEDWETFRQYNIRDVETEMGIQKMISPFPCSEELWQEYWIDQRINDRGVEVDLTLAKNAVEMSRELSQDLKDRMRDLTGLENPNSTAQLDLWLSEHGVDMDSLGKKDVAAVIDATDDPLIKEVLQLRLQSAKSSVKKYETMLRATCSDGRARGMFQFYGAMRTGRFAGRLLQLQNLPQNHIENIGLVRELARRGDLEALSVMFDSVPDILSQLIRTAFVAREGSRFIVADFSAIEARVIAWLAGEEWVLEAFAANRDIYCETASKMFGVPVVKHGINGDLRQKGKISALACGYGGSVGALKAFGADKMGLTDDRLQELVNQWRAANPHIVKLWWDVDRAIKQTLEDGTTHRTHGLMFSLQKGILFIRLPSGRSLAYVKPRLIDGKITYEGVSSNKGWSRLESYGPKFVENCLAEGTQVLTDRGWIEIQNVTTKDALWDGEQWVSHEGLINKGIQEVINIDGALMTPNHKVLTQEGWKNAATCEGLNRYEVRIPNSFELCRKECKRTLTDKSKMRLWKRNYFEGIKLFIWPLEVVWMQKNRYDSSRDNYSWEETSSFIQNMGSHEKKMFKQKMQKLEKLWRQGDQGLRQMVKFISEFLGRYVFWIQERAVFRPHRCQRELLSRELQMGGLQNPGQKQEKLKIFKNPVGRYNTSGSRREIKDSSGHVTKKNISAMARGYVIYKAKSSKPVYDLKNAGPNHRFTIKTEAGPMIVHNCVQGISRDLLLNAMKQVGPDARICMHIHDELVIEADSSVKLDDICQKMAQVPEWAEGLLLRADGYETKFYLKD